MSKNHRKGNGNDRHLRDSSYDEEEITNPDSRPTIIILKELQKDMDLVKSQIGVIMDSYEAHRKEMAGFMQTVLNIVGSVRADIDLLLIRSTELEDRTKRIEQHLNLPPMPSNPPTPAE